MDKLRCMEVFVTVVEQGSLSAAAAALRLSPSMVSTHLSNLESHLGVRLLNRTTRRINMTDEGVLYYSHCQQVHEEISVIESTLVGSHLKPRGRVRIDSPSIIAQHLVVPLLNEFLQRYPDIQLDLTDSEHITDTVEGQYDVVIRLGPLGDSELIARALGYSPLVTVASPSYIKAHGIPKVPEDLHKHHCISHQIKRTGRFSPWKFERNGKCFELDLPSKMSITQGNVQIEAALRGFGLIQGMGFYLQQHLETGALVQVLPEWLTLAPQMEMLYPRGRRASRKVHAFVDFMLDNYPAGEPIMSMDMKVVDHV